MAWKILRGAEVASTRMLTVGGVADQPKDETKNRKKQKRSEGFILTADSVDENERHSEKLDYSSEREEQYRNTFRLDDHQTATRDCFRSRQDLAG